MSGDNNRIAGDASTLYVSDMDGTLLRPDAELSSYTVETLNRLIRGGMSFTVASARSLASARAILAPLALSLPVILMNGVQIYDLRAGRFLHVEYIPEEALHLLLDLFKFYDVSGFLYGLVDDLQTTYYETLGSPAQKAFMEERIQRYQKPFTQVSSYRDIADRGICYVSLMGKHDRLVPVRDALSRIPGLAHVFYADVYFDEEWLLEIHSAQASKGHAVRSLRDRFGFGRLVGFGDNLNDQSMFAVCDETYAVGNAHPVLAASATGQIGTNRDDGVARWLAAQYE